MEQLNKIELKGNVGNCKVQTIGESQVAKVSLATNYVYKNKDGNTAIETTWHNVIIWSSSDAPKDLNIIEKGMTLHIIGRLRQQRFTGADGIERVIYEVVAKNVTILSSNNKEAK